MTTALDRELDSMADDLIAKESMPQTDAQAMVHRPAPAPRRMARSDEASFPTTDRNLAVGVHLGTLGATLFSGGLFVPLLVPLLAKILLKDASPELKEHIRQQLNLQITIAGVAGVGILATMVTFGLAIFALLPVLLFFFGVEIVASIKGTMAAQRGESYQFPFTLNVIKPDDHDPVAQLGPRR
jgi:uncharacterized Tic20 family protein